MTFAPAGTARPGPASLMRSPSIMTTGFARTFPALASSIFAARTTTKCESAALVFWEINGLAKSSRTATVQRRALCVKETLKVDCEIKFLKFSTFESSKLLTHAVDGLTKRSPLYALRTAFNDRRTNHAIWESFTHKPNRDATTATIIPFLLRRLAS